VKLRVDIPSGDDQIDLVKIVDGVSDSSLTFSEKTRYRRLGSLPLRTPVKLEAIFKASA
jgi:hypothetical protein